MNVLKKIQAQPKYIRKIILWLAVIILTTSLLILWTKNLSQRFGSFQKEEFNEELEGIPKIEIPEIDKEKIKELEEQIKGIEEKSQ